ncbi:class I SAM-dependent methyltransferase [Streptomyces sp. NPDC008150]|uniref:O-methyltransferase n=1 Tax=Streptomyces sp. NPDC008150 TaxID=3364816 RepID=UPI0036F00C69
MSVIGTASHLNLAADTLPPLVARAVDTARAQDFAYSCRPEQGRLLHALAGGARRIGETGTGCGVGLAWLLAGAPDGARLVSVEADPGHARVCAGLFGSVPGVEILAGDWPRIAERAPYDLLVLDGGGMGKADGDPPADVGRLLAPGGTVVVDDFTPPDATPPELREALDGARQHWLEHPLLRTVELRLAPDLSTLVGTLRSGH